VEAIPCDIVGRGAELDALDACLDRLDREPAAVVFEGQAGIGKTTVWSGVFERAARRRLTVLSCRPAEPETKLAFASLADLLEPVAETILPQLPEPQRMALDVALMRTSPRGTAPSARAVAMAVLSTLRTLSGTTPVVLAIDDQQWLDRASAEALAFALRRIGDRRVGVVGTVRLQDDGARDPLGLREAFKGRIERVEVGPLSLSALHHLIRSHLAHVFPRPTLRHITETSGGNPFFALEQARALIEAGEQVRPGDPVPVPETLLSIVMHRLERLPVLARRLLLLASALAAPTVDLVGDAAAGGDVASSLAGAQQARVIELHDRHIRFVHPLLAYAIYSSVSPEARRALHRRLADVIASPEERARHLALAAAAPDEDVARALDDASSMARRRGAPDAAGELQELAARLTPLDDPEASRRRRTSAAEHFFHAGDRAHARALLETMLAEPTAGAERAKALRLLGQIRGHEDSFADAAAYLREALAHADEPSLSAPIKLDLAFATFSLGDLPAAIDAAREALSDAERLGNPGLVADALCVVVMGEFMAGRGTDYVRIQRALALEDRTRAGQLLLRPTSMIAMIATYEGRLSDADGMLREQSTWATERGEESELPFLLFHLAQLEWWRGEFGSTARYAEEAIMLASQTGSETMRSIGLLWRAAARSGCGDVAVARADFEESRALIDKTGYVQGDLLLRMIKAASDLSLGDVVTVERTLAPLIAVVEATGLAEGSFFGEPFAVYFVPDAVEALIALDQVPRATAVLELFARLAERLERPWALASVARCRGLLAAAQGDLDAALLSAEDAVARWRRLEMPIELGRALLVLGLVRRRRGDRRLARDALTEALAVFRDRGATPWADRATEELARIPIRRGAPDDLTPTEEQVATLAGEGRTNREIGRALFIGVKAVEANLTRVYAKLGIRSRAELGLRMLERRTTAEHPSKK
jgi:DNA-binding CsgD family transcriptional regulator